MSVDSLLAADNALMASRLSADREAYDRLLAPEFIGVDVAGNVSTKVQRLAAFASVVYSAIETDQHVARVLGDTGLVTARMRAEGTVGAERFSGVYRYTHVYRNAGDGWRAVATHICQIDR